MYQVIATGSKGNSVLYHNSIMVDCGVPFSYLKPHLRNIQLVLLTHVHQDHLNLKTLRKLADERPTLRIGCGEFLKDKLEGFKNVDIYQSGQVYDYGVFKIVPVTLYHDVPNFGYRIFKGDHKMIHITDTATLEGIEANGYDLFAIEHNYDEDTVFGKIEKLKASGQFAYQEGAINSHLSEQKAREFIYKNKSEHSQVLRLHETSLI